MLDRSSRLGKIVKGMTDDNGSPNVGPSAKELGARPGTYIKVGSSDDAHPNSGGFLQIQMVCLDIVSHQNLVEPEKIPYGSLIHLTWGMI